MSRNSDLSHLDYYHHLLLSYFDKLGKDEKLENYREIDAALGILINYQTIRTKVKELKREGLINIDKKGNQNRPYLIEKGKKYVAGWLESPDSELVRKEIDKQLEKKKE